MSVHVKAELLKSYHIGTYPVRYLYSFPIVSFKDLCTSLLVERISVLLFDEVLLFGVILYLGPVKQ